MDFKQLKNKIKKLGTKIASRVLTVEVIKATVIWSLIFIVLIGISMGLLSLTQKSREANKQKVNIQQVELVWEPKNYSWHKSKDEEAVNFFDLFTPPNIFIKDERVIFEKSDQEIIFGTFPLKLEKIEKKLYRVQFEGYVDLSIKKAGDSSTILLFDVEKRESIKCAEGVDFEDKGFSIKSFSFDQRELNGARVTRPIVVISDYREGRLIELTNEPEFYNDQFEITLKDLLSHKFVFSKEGETLSVGDSKCTLLAFDYDKKSAKINLTDVDGQEFVKELFLEN